eukprot:1096565-Rhodomonas_salina.1
MIARPLHSLVVGLGVGRPPSALPWQLTAVSQATVAPPSGIMAARMPVAFNGSSWPRAGPR